MREGSFGLVRVLKLVVWLIWLGVAYQIWRALG